MALLQPEPFLKPNWFPEQASSDLNLFKKQYSKSLDIIGLMAILRKSPHDKDFAIYSLVFGIGTVTKFETIRYITTQKN